jgi:hypothetical protein
MGGHDTRGVTAEAHLIRLWGWRSSNAGNNRRRILLRVPLPTLEDPGVMGACRLGSAESAAIQVSHVHSASLA